MTAEPDLFPGFAERRINTGGTAGHSQKNPSATLAALLPFIAAQGGGR